VAINEGPQSSCLTAIVELAKVTEQLFLKFLTKGVGERLDHFGKSRGGFIHDGCGGATATKFSACSSVSGGQIASLF
jgi:hypothetical protein